MAGKDEPFQESGQRPAAPHPDGPLSGSGAAPPPEAAPAASEPAASPPAASPPAASPPAAVPSAPDSPAPKADKPDIAPPAAAPTAAQPAVGGAPAAGRVLRRFRPRRVHPVAAARTVGRATAAWSRRPSGRVIVPGVLVVLLVGVAGTAGAYLVPEAIDAMPAASAPPSQPGAAPSDAPVVPGPGLPGPIPPAGPGAAPPGQPGARPADALTGWAQQVGPKVGIPVVAAQAYGYAELVLSRTAPACRLSWTTVAALAKVESEHGSANGAVLGVDGQALPPIVGLPLDGQGGRLLIKDTDRGALDSDTVYDRAMGPLQFVPTTWRENAVDADSNGVTDPNDIDDAALTAGMYLCRGGRDLSKADDWWSAILSYNNVQPYAQQVFTEANNYGRRSRT